MADKVAVAYQIVDHGIRHSQYFDGCGTSFTDFTDVATGIGDTFEEALDDALENLASAGWNVEIVVPEDDTNDVSVSAVRDRERKLQKADALSAAREEDDFDEEDFEEEYEDEDNDGDERWYTVSVRVRAFDPDYDDRHMKYVGIAIGRLDKLEIDIHNAQTASSKVTAGELEAMRNHRDKLERYLKGREIVIPPQTTFNR